MLHNGLRRPDFARAEREATKLVREFGYTKPPIDPVLIAREKGMKVYFVRFAASDSNVSGYYDCEDDSINVNREEYPQRQTFTVAHELGHKVLHEEWARSSEYKVLLRDQSADSDDSFEKEANTFAAHLLVPSSMLRHYRHESIDTLATLFSVSRPVVTFRLRNEFGL